MSRFKKKIVIVTCIYFACTKLAHILDNDNERDGYNKTSNKKYQHYTRVMFFFIPNPLNINFFLQNKSVKVFFSTAALS